MDETIYARWWQLHLSVARGEKLDATAQADYDAGQAELDAEERALWENANLTALRRLKAEVEKLETSHDQLQSRSRSLDRQVWTLEGAYMGLTGLELSGQGYGVGSVRRQERNTTTD